MSDLKNWLGGFAQKHCSSNNEPSPVGNPQRTAKFDPGDQSIPPNPEMEKDPSILAYEWNPGLGRYHVTKYDTKLVRFGENGVPLTGVVVRVQGQETRLEDAIPYTRELIVAKVKALKVIADAPMKVSALKHCLPALTAVTQALAHASKAQALFSSNKHEAAAKELLLASRLYDDAAQKLNKAQRDIQFETEVGLGVLERTWAAGKVALIGLSLVSGGAASTAVGGALRAKNAANWVTALAELATSAVVKTAVQSGTDAVDKAVHSVDQPVDWEQFGWDTLRGLFENLLADAVTAGAMKGIQKSVGETAKIPRLKVFLAQLKGNLSARLLTTSSKVVAELATRKQRASTRQVAQRAVAKDQAALLQIVENAAKDAGIDVASSGFDAMLVVQELQKALVK